MMWTTFLVLMGLWLLGVVGNVTFGGLVHLLLLVALATVLVQLIVSEGQRPA